MGKAAADRNITIEKKELYVPDLKELADALTTGLKLNFREAKCCVVDCPDLTLPPFQLAAPGLCGKTRLAEIGGVPNLLPNTKYMEKVYDAKYIQKQIELPGAFMLGAGAGSKHVVGCNCECMPNIWLPGNNSAGTDNTHISKVNTDDQSHILEHYAEKYNSSEYGLMSNLFCSEGKPGKVLKVEAKERIGGENFVSCIRKAALAKYGNKPVGLGGAFLVKKGSIKIHVMPDFCLTPLKTEAELNNWLNFYTAKSPFMCLSTLVSCEPTRCDDRIEHTHGYSLENSEGGHYHEDVTPDEIEYSGYYSPAEIYYRLDRPEQMHAFE